MPRHARHDLRIDQFNTHFTRAEYRMFLALAQWRDQDVHAWLRETITREYRQFLRLCDPAGRAAVLAWVEAFLASVDAEAIARRQRATTRSGPPNAPYTDLNTDLNTDLSADFAPDAAAAHARVRRRVASPERPGSAGSLARPVSVPPPDTPPSGSRIADALARYETALAGAVLAAHDRAHPDASDAKDANMDDDPPDNGES